MPPQNWHISSCFGPGIEVCGPHELRKGEVTRLKVLREGKDVEQEAPFKGFQAPESLETMLFHSF